MNFPTPDFLVGKIKEREFQKSFCHSLPYVYTYLVNTLIQTSIILFDNTGVNTAGGGLGAHEIVIAPDPVTGELKQQIIQTVLDPITGQPNQVMIPFDGGEYKRKQLMIYNIVAWLICDTKIREH